jgi:hypothetical protein
MRSFFLSPMAHQILEVINTLSIAQLEEVESLIFCCHLFHPKNKSLFFWFFLFQSNYASIPLMC